jgi:hypothetical protein
MGTSLITTTRHRVQARIAARFGKLSRLAVVSTTATLAVVAVGVAAAPAPDAAPAQPTSLRAASSAADLAHFAETRERRVSRTAPRVSLQPKATDHKFATSPLNVWTAPREEGKRLGLLKWGTEVAVTGQVVGHWAEVLLPAGKQQVVRWVNADYLANRKPKPEKPAKPAKPEPTSSTPTSSSTGAPASAPSTGGTCTNGTSVSGTPGVVAIHQAVCANWPAITGYGTYRADSGDHGSGRAIDIMISGATGWEIAEFVRANASQFGVSYVIYAQKIWSVDRAGEGWRYMEDRGSTTANHYDHVHVSVY